MSGWNRRSLRRLGQAQDVAKLSRADMAACIATGGTGATTVAATMIAAHLAGIHVFATGGIGGVHRGAERSFDISADLQELAQTPVTVVGAGAKAILDLPKTFEVLETLGVPVIAYGQDRLPAFWSCQFRSARAFAHGQARGYRRSPQDAHAPWACKAGSWSPTRSQRPTKFPQRCCDPIIAQALDEAEAQGISAKAVTPFLLGRIFELTEGRSLTANIALVRNNARLLPKLPSQWRNSGVTRRCLLAASHGST